MKTDFMHRYCVVSPMGGQCTMHRLIFCCALLCLIAPMSIGCQFAHEDHAAKPHYGQLEQACFGYEPTVWRTMADGCEQAVRMIPNEVIQVPAAPEQASPATDQPGASVLDQVPESEGLLPRFMRDAFEAPAAPEEGAPQEKEGAPQEMEPADIPPQEQPAEPAADEPAADEPAAEPRAAITPPPAASDLPTTEPSVPQDSSFELPQAPVPPAAEPETSSTSHLPAPAPTGGPSWEPTPATAPAPVSEPRQKFSQSPNRTPATPVALRPAAARSSAGAANELFRTLEEAIGAPSTATNVAAQRPADKGSAIGLARFISF
ncbi:MAG: hypothetical protein ACYC0X_06695 [Pirellulaceae bacterium]